MIFDTVKLFLKILHWKYSLCLPVSVSFLVTICQLIRSFPLHMHNFYLRVFEECIYIFKYCYSRNLCIKVRFKIAREIVTFQNIQILVFELNINTSLNKLVGSMILIQCKSRLSCTNL